MISLFKKEKAKEPKDSGGVTKKCNHCGKTGHLEKDCWEKDPSKKATKVHWPVKFSVEFQAKFNQYRQ